MRLFGLVGHPLTHSFSKKYFTEKFDKEGMADCRYELFPIESMEQFRGLLQANPELEGLNITVPYKKQVLSFLNDTQHIPVSLDACNCIRIRNGNLIGYNTDWIGFSHSLLPLLQPHHTKAMVLGNGGATAAVIFVLQKSGIESTIVSRTLHHNSGITYQEIDEAFMQEHTIIINTTPLGMYPRENACPEIPYPYITSKHLLYDLVYNPEKTLFLQKGEEQGASIKNGAEMLVLQAEESWRIWNEI